MTIFAALWVVAITFKLHWWCRWLALVAFLGFALVPVLLALILAKLACTFVFAKLAATFLATATFLG